MFNSASAGFTGVGKLLTGCCTVGCPGSVPADVDCETEKCMGVNAIMTPEREGEIGPWVCECDVSVDSSVGDG